VREGERAKWSEGECKFCPHKKFICKIDYENKITKLSESNLIGFSKSRRPNYNPAEVRKRVLARWGLKEETDGDLSAAA
jgi:hypothetical protein